MCEFEEQLLVTKIEYLLSVLEEREQEYGNAYKLLYYLYQYTYVPPLQFLRVMTFLKWFRNKVQEKQDNILDLAGYSCIGLCLINEKDLHLAAAKGTLMPEYKKILVKMLNKEYRGSILDLEVFKEPEVSWLHKLSNAFIFLQEDYSDFFKSVLLCSLAMLEPKKVKKKYAPRAHYRKVDRV